MRSSLLNLSVAVLLCAPMLPCATASMPGAGVDTAAVVQGDSAQDLDRLRRDQAEILRKAERLRDVMTRLLARYESEGRVEQTKLLKTGLQHLEKGAILESVAGIRNDLDAQAFARAFERQAAVVAELERLLDILLDRRSMETLEQEIKTAERMAADAAELLRRQTELQAQTRESTASEPTPAERALSEQLRELARRQREEATNNLRQAGPRMPFLEDALARIRRLLAQQKTLEKRAEQQVNNTGQPDPEREQAFELGDLAERARELMDERSRGREWQRARDLAGELEQAVERKDVDAKQSVFERLMEQLERLARSPRNEDGKATRAAADELAQAGGRDASPEALAQAARRARELAEKRAGERREAGNAQAKALEEAMAKSEANLSQGKNEKPPAAKSVEEARAQLRAAESANAKNNNEEQMSALARASRALGEARQRFEAANPDAAKVADEMAAEAARTARSLRGSPQGDETERKTADALDQAERALREAADRLEQRRTSQEQVQQSREALEKAQQTLDEAMAGQQSERGASAEQAGERQKALREQAAQASRDLQAGAERGEVSPQQQQAAGERMKQASAAMQRAEQALQRGEQANAAEQQRRAADELQQAEQALRAKRELTPEQKDALRQQEQAQKQIEDDIIKLAQEAEQRRNRKASQALQQAQQASKNARQEMQQGDPEETDQQQEQAKDALEKAQEALEEERDRYMDLRQEELLFKIREELEQLLQKQTEVSQQTATASTELEGGARMTRPLRRRLNELGEREGEIASRSEFMRAALVKEEEVVYSQLLGSIAEDLTEVGRRLGGNQPDPGEFTQTVQMEVQDRLVELIAALKREQQRRQQEQQQQQQGQQGGNQPNGRKPLVPLRAELTMLKRLEADTLRRIERLQKLVEMNGADGVSEAELRLIDRLASRHGEITRTFEAVRAKIEAALQQQAADGADPGKEDNGRGK